MEAIDKPKVKHCLIVAKATTLAKLKMYCKLMDEKGMSQHREARRLIMEEVDRRDACKADITKNLNQPRNYIKRLMLEWM